MLVQVEGRIDPNDVKDFILTEADEPAPIPETKCDGRLIVCEIAGDGGIDRGSTDLFVPKLRVRELAQFSPSEFRSPSESQNHVGLGPLFAVRDAIVAAHELE